MISIRRIRIGEAELFKRIRITSLRESPSAFGSTYESALRRTPESWSEQADSTAQGSDRSTFIAFSDDSPIGISALYRVEDGSDVGELLQMWVSPEHRGRGVATRIMNAVFQWAGENGFRTVIATLARGNAMALKFFREYGFKPASGASLDSPDDHVVLMKEVEVKRAHTTPESATDA